MRCSRKGGHMLRNIRILALLAALLPPGAALAQGVDGAKAPPAKKAARPAKDPADGLRGEWHRAGPGFACQVQSKQKLTPGPDMAMKLSMACQHMGPLIVGAEARVLDARFGAPFRT